MRLFLASELVLLLVTGAWGVVPGMVGGLQGHEVGRVEEALRRANISLQSFVEVFENATKNASPLVLAELQGDQQSWPNITYNDLRCLRDLLTILDAVKNTQMWAFKSEFYNFLGYIQLFIGT
jgi:hypothetical protein